MWRFLSTGLRIDEESPGMNVQLSEAFLEILIVTELMIFFFQSRIKHKEYRRPKIRELSRFAGHALPAPWITSWRQTFPKASRTACLMKK